MSKNVKKKIIQTAYDLFKEKGYDATTVNDICQACSITKPTFYRHVASKEDTLAYSFDQINDEIGSLVKKLASTDDYYNQIISAFDLVIDRMLYFGKDLYCQLYITNLKNNKGTFDEIKILKEIVLILIEKGQSNNQIRQDCSPEILYDLCSNICYGCGIRWCMNQIEDVREEIIKHLYLVLCIK